MSAPGAVAHRVSDRALRVTMLVLSVIGMGVASYLTYTHYAGINPVCSFGGGCETVQASSYSKLAGVPVAVLGLIGYVTIIGLLLAPSSENVRLAVLSVVTVGFGFSLYLTFREAFTIKAYCQWCLSSAGIMTLLMGLATTRFLRGDEPRLPPPTDAQEPPQPPQRSQVRAQAG
jgi:uncharacterized membrane protein